jgi:hypothetical protein
MKPLSLAMSDPYAYGSDKKSEVRDKLLTDWAEIGLMKTTKMKTFCIGRMPGSWCYVWDPVGTVAGT